jgi:hypothetical protein
VTRVANLRAADKPGAENRYALTETTNDAKYGAVHSNIDAGNFVLNGERRRRRPSELRDSRARRTRST